MATSRYIDMVGQKYGLLTVVEFVGKDKFNNALWRCKCDCGKEKVVSRRNLISGNTSSCGCLHKPDHTGKRFGRLTVLSEVGANPRRRIIWKCKCDCGNIVEVTSSALMAGCTRSCGCLMRETAKETMVTHGKTGTRLYTVWEGMKARCRNKNHEAYHNYGGRGISICDEWKDFSAFEKWALENGYNENAKRGECTIDRINVNGNYEPSNCRWVDMKTQASNRRLKTKRYAEGGRINVL